MRIMDAFARCLDLFEGDIEAAKTWMFTASRGGTRPIEALKTEEGYQEVLNRIGRLEYGVF